MSPDNPKLLIIDDEKAYLSDFQTLFARKFNTVTASSAEEALAVLEKEEVGVVISDQRMPRKTGSQLLTIIRERWPRTVRILLTGYCDIDALAEAVNKGGIYYYLTKDRPLAEIEEVIRQAFLQFKPDAMSRP